MNLGGLRVFDLEQPRKASSPVHPAHVPPGYSYLLHRRHQQGALERRTGASGVLISSEHSGTHIDALCHQAEDVRIHGGRAADALQTAFGFKELGVETIPPMVSRGWLIDLGELEPSRWISLSEVRQAADARGVTPASGDVVLVRTGNGRYWSDPERYLRGAGMAGEVSQWLAGAGVAAVGADNMAWDWLEGTDPLTGTTLPGHVILLVRSGIYIVENLYLDELAAARVVTFTFICLPLKLVGATGSPVRPIALVEGTQEG